MNNTHDHDLDLFFLGSKSEQRQLLQEAVQLVLADHIFWRRNYYPKDPPPIPYPVVEGDEARQYKELFFSELFALISDLKLDVPVFSPRYMAHMLSETTLPSLVAYYATLLYNPNNVTSEASPVTIGYELEVGDQFARLFGFPVEKAFGHLASGGTIANYESLWFNRAGRFLPLSLDLARRHVHGRNGKGDADTFWEKMNLPYPEVERDLFAFLSEEADTPDEAMGRLRPFLPSHTGDRAFQRLVEEAWQVEWKDPVVLASQTSHYCWSRAVSLFGIGKDNMLRIDVDEEFRVRPESYRQTLEKCLNNRQPVVQTVLVLGSTEFGSVDPIDEIVSVRDEMAQRGIYTPIHVDAAYGGYFAAMFRSGNRHAALGTSDLFRDTPWLPGAIRAVSRCDSVTVDPHKAGYVPYGAGCIVHRHGFLKDIVAETAPYVLDSSDETARGNAIPQLGRFIMEGSKPGAAAAATWFSHRLIPLNMDGYGRQLAALCRTARRFEAELRRRAGDSEGGVRLLPVTHPHTNIVCLFVLPDEARRLSEVNALNAALAVRFGVKDVISIQSYDYLVSHTTISVGLPWFSTERHLERLELDAERIDLLRLVFMNRWVEKRTASGKAYLDEFHDQLVAEAQVLWKAR